MPMSTVYVTFSAEIAMHTTEALIGAMARCANDGVSEVHLLLSTSGGNVMNGMNLYNLLRAMPFTLVTHNVGNVDSIGNAVFLAGERRYACAHSTFMFHGVSYHGGGPFSEQRLKERLESVLADQTRLAGIIAERTVLTPDQIEPLFRDEQTRDAAYAVDHGFVHEIRDVEIPPGARLVSLVFLP